MILTVRGSCRIAKVFLVLVVKAITLLRPPFIGTVWCPVIENIKKVNENSSLFQPATLLEKPLMLLVVTFPAPIFPTTMTQVGFVPGISRCLVGKSSN